jgi:hypothetical protein
LVINACIYTQLIKHKKILSLGMAKLSFITYFFRFNKKYFIVNFLSSLIFKVTWNTKTFNSPRIQKHFYCKNFMQTAFFYPIGCTRTNTRTKYPSNPPLTSLIAYLFIKNYSKRNFIRKQKGNKKYTTYSRRTLFKTHLKEYTSSFLNYSLLWVYSI